MLRRHGTRRFTVLVKHANPRVLVASTRPSKALAFEHVSRCSPQPFCSRVRLCFTCSEVPWLTMIVIRLNPPAGWLDGLPEPGAGCSGCPVQGDAQFKQQTRLSDRLAEIVISSLVFHHQAPSNAVLGGPKCGRNASTVLPITARHPCIPREHVTEGVLPLCFDVDVLTVARWVDCHGMTFHLTGEGAGGGEPRLHGPAGGCAADERVGAGGDRGHGHTTRCGQGTRQPRRQGRRAAAATQVGERTQLPPSFFGEYCSLQLVARK